MRPGPVIRAGALSCMVLGMVVSTVEAAQPVIRVHEKFYDLTSTNGRALKREMARKGPKGYWAYTRWNIRWSSSCKVELTINYAYPRLKDPSRLSLPVRQNWQNMMAKLTSHEQNHGAHGLSAAQEIVDDNCRNAHAIIKKWASEDKVYDNKTRHGLNEGVKLAG